MIRMIFFFLIIVSPSFADTMADAIDKYKRGGLCLSFDCTVEHDKSLTIIFSSNDQSLIVSRYSDSLMIYRYAERFLKRTLNSMSSPLESKNILDPTIDNRIDSAKVICQEIAVPVLSEALFFNPMHICRLNATDTLLGKFFRIGGDIVEIRKNYDFWWGILLSHSGSVVKNQKCDNKSCSSLLGCPVKFAVSSNDKVDTCVLIDNSGELPMKRVPCSQKQNLQLSACEMWLRCVAMKYAFIYHIGSMPQGECDISNWRGVKMESLTTKERAEIQTIMRFH